MTNNPTNDETIIESGLGEIKQNGLNHLSFEDFGNVVNVNDLIQGNNKIDDSYLNTIIPA